MKPLSPRMIRALAYAVERPGGVTSNGATIDALIRRGLVEAPSRVYGQRAMKPTAEGQALIESMGGPAAARKSVSA